MDKHLFLGGFALMMGIWNIWLVRETGGKWRWIGAGMVSFGTIVLGLFYAGIRVIP